MGPSAGARTQRRAAGGDAADHRGNGVDGRRGLDGGGGRRPGVQVSVGVSRGDLYADGRADIRGLELVGRLRHSGHAGPLPAHQPLPLVGVRGAGGTPGTGRRGQRAAFKRGAGD